jgi:hypothetical protein
MRYNEIRVKLQLNRLLPHAESPRETRVHDARVGARTGRRTRRGIAQATRLLNYEAQHRAGTPNTNPRAQRRTRKDAPTPTLALIDDRDRAITP